MKQIHYNGCLSDDTIKDCFDLMEKYSYCIEITKLPEDMDEKLYKTKWFHNTMGDMETIQYGTTFKDFQNKEEGLFLFLKHKKNYDKFIEEYKNSDIIINKKPLSISFISDRKKPKF